MVTMRTVARRAAVRTGVGVLVAVSLAASGMLTGTALARSTPAPVQLTIPAIGVHTEVMRLGLRRDGSLEVPPDRRTAGWFTGGPAAGQIGPAVIAGHVHWNGLPGVFARLGKLKYDDRITVARSDGSAAVFRVTRVSQFRKSSFPTELVYGNAREAGLRLITCAGLNTSTHTYRDNVVVFAVLVALRAPAARGSS